MVKDISNSIKQIAEEAGKLILRHYNAYEPVSVQYKKDNSPVTIADEEANQFIVAELKKLTPNIPIIAEEDVEKGIIPDVKDEFWLVDPIDGTKEFINKNGEFTVNIALIKNNAPILGVIHIPVQDKTYIAKSNGKAYYIDNTNIEKQIQMRDYSQSAPTILVSRSHRGGEIDKFLKNYPGYNEKSIGSSIKFCFLASGEADLYPRFTPTMEWDTAAGHAIVIAGGGEVYDLDGKPLRYGKDNFLNPYFIAKHKE